MDPLSVIASAIAITQAISSTYKTIQHLKGLPKEFNEVHKNLPLVQDTLRLAQDQLKAVEPDESSRKAIVPILNSCKNKSKKLQDIFEKVRNDAKDGPVLDFYRAVILRLGKTQRVETLMQGMLKDLKAVAVNQLFRTATRSQVVELEEAIDRLSRIESSVPDSEFDTAGTQINQNVAAGGTGNQAVNTGDGSMTANFGGYNFSSAGGPMHIALPQTEDRRNKILRALDTSPYLSRKNRYPDRVPGTCQWFVEHSLFRQWRESRSSSMLWVSADPGCGKSVLAKYLVDVELPTTESRTTCYFFFKDDFEDQRTARGALSCILHQLFMHRAILFSDEIVKRFEASAEHTNSLDGLWEVLVLASQDKNAGEIVCILDAFDECESQEQSTFAKTLCQFYTTGNNVNLKFLVTSRPYNKIRRSFQPPNIPGLSIIHLRGESEEEIWKISGEIDVYIKTKVSSIRESKDLTPDEEQLLLQQIRRIPNRTYLWVYLTLDWIENEIDITRTEIRRVASSLPRTVDDAYEKILTKCADRRGEVKKLLQIIVAAARPLTLKEMDVALALQQNHEPCQGLDLRHGRIGNYLRELCGLFVSIVNSKVYLLHQTARDFLIRKEPLDIQVPGHQSNHLIWKSSIRPRESHNVLCQICIWYLLWLRPRPLDECDISQRPHKHVFLEYAVTKWILHFRSSDMEDDTALDLVLALFDATAPLGRCPTWFRIGQTPIGPGYLEDFTTLMIASYFGLERVVQSLLERDNSDINSTERMYGHSALSLASQNGFVDVVKLLINGRRMRLTDFTKLSFSKGAKVDIEDKFGQTPLSHAATNGHENVVRLLLDRGANIEAADHVGRTPLSHAAKEGGKVFMRLLLDKIASIEAVNHAGQAPLPHAAMMGREAVVRLLLDKGANIEAADHAGRTPLWHAAMMGGEDVVRLLLGRSANIEATNGVGQTPLSCAAMMGHEDVVRLLLDKGANIEAADHPGRTPLSNAAMMGHVDVVRLLLGRSANIEAADRLGWTPLSIARREHVKRLLLEKGAKIEVINP